jgi:hypothetical protein
MYQKMMETLFTNDLHVVLQHNVGGVFGCMCVLHVDAVCVCKCVCVCVCVCVGQ